MTFGSSPLYNRDGSLVGDQLDMTLAENEQRPPPMRRRASRRVACRRQTWRGMCGGELIAKPGGMWICALCGTRTVAGDA